MMVMDGPFYFNGLSFDMMRIDYQIPLNQTEIWTLMDSTMVAHPFHVHDVQFFVLDRDGNSPPPEERGWKDVVLVQPNETVRIIMKFTDFVDSVIPYMYHCHILMHEDDGMMGQFVVMPQGWSGINNSVVPFADFRAYPNPVKDCLNIKIENKMANYPVEINIFDALGRNVYSNFFIEKDIRINTSQWNKGFYTLNVKQDKNCNYKKLIIE
jgi:bilirubin oxidase